MILQILVLVIIAGLILFQMSQGLFSALVMAICSILAAVFAFEFGPAAAEAWLIGTFPEYAHAVAFVGVFAITLGVLRLLADKLLPGMVHLPYLADRIGGAALGIVPALIITGVAVMSWQMLPMGRSLMGFTGFPVVEEPPADAAAAETPPANKLWLRPVGFTVGLAEMLSAGALSDGERFDQVHPDYAAELAGFTHVPAARFSQATPDAFKPLTIRGVDEQGQAIEVASAAAPADWTRAAAGLGGDLDFSELPEPLRGLAEADNPGEPAVVGVGDRYLRVSVFLSPAGGDEEDKAIRFTGGQMQLVCRPVDSNGRVLDAPGHLAFAEWVLPDGADETTIEPLGVNQVYVQKPTDRSNVYVSVLFRVPEGFAPWFVRYKKLTRAPVRMLAKGQSVQPPVIEPPAMTKHGTWPLDNIQVIASPQMPIKLMVKGEGTGTAATSMSGPGGKVELEDKRLVRGNLTGPRGGFFSLPGGWPVEQFAAQPGHRVVIVEGQAKSLLMPVFWQSIRNAAVQVDDKDLPLAGMYVSTDSKRWLLFYDRDMPPAAMNQANVTQLLETGKPLRVGLILQVPERASKFTLDIGANRKIEYKLK